MPTVGKKRFPYNQKGQAQARAYAKSTGKPLQMAPVAPPTRGMGAEAGSASRLIPSMTPLRMMKGGKVLGSKGGRRGKK